MDSKLPQNVDDEIETEDNSTPNHVESSQIRSSNRTEEMGDKQYINSQGVRFMSDDPNLEGIA